MLHFTGCQSSTVHCLKIADVPLVEPTWYGLLLITIRVTSSAALCCTVQQLDLLSHVMQIKHSVPIFIQYYLIEKYVY